MPQPDRTPSAACPNCGAPVVTGRCSSATCQNHNGPSAAQGQGDPLAGLPDDLARVLRDQSIIVPQDAAVFELVAKWMDAPSDTASALTADEWQQAWSITCRRMLAARAENERLRAALCRVTGYEDAEINSLLAEYDRG